MGMTTIHDVLEFTTEEDGTIEVQTGGYSFRVGPEEFFEFKQYVERVLWEAARKARDYELGRATGKWPP